MHQEFAISATRAGMEGILDKIVLIEAMADKYAGHREIQNLALKTVKGTGNSADNQLWAWEKYLEKLPYRREPGEILRNPIDTAKYGGDCDDLVVLALAGAKALGFPAKAEVVADSGGNGFHVRALVGLPPIDPQVFVVLDPVYRSEPEWAMQGKDVTLASAKFRSVIRNGNRTSRLTLSPAILLVVGAGLLWFVSRK